MVEEQLLPRGIDDQRTIEAFLKVPRHEFIPEDSRISAYGDHPVPIGEGQTISQPYIVALMTQYLKLTGSEKTLEIGTGSGYQTAILAALTDSVYTVERSGTLSQAAQALLKRLGYVNIHFLVGDGTLGWPEQAPFDRIITTAYAPRVPQPLVDQLNEGGRLIVPVGNTFTQMLTLVERKQGQAIVTEICPCVFVPLVGKHGARL